MTYAVSNAFMGIDNRLSTVFFDLEYVASTRSITVCQYNLILLICILIHKHSLKHPGPGHR